MALPSSGQVRALMRRPVRGLATILRIARRDGVNLFLTDNATDITISGVMYRAGATIEVSATQSLADLKERNLEIRGANVSAFISEQDIYAGLYREAAVTVSKVDCIYPEFGLIRTDQYELDRVSQFDSERFSAELSGIARKLRQRVGGFVSRTCDYVFADPDSCRFSLAQADARYFGVDVVAVTVGSERQVFTASTDLASLNPFGDRYWQDGIVTWTSGANVGTRPGIVKRFDISANPRRITLHQKTKFPIQVGDLFNIQGGCQFTTAACDERANRINYGGQEFLPSANNNIGGF